MVYSNTTVYGGNDGIFGHLHIFTFDANNAFEVQFLQVSFLHLITDTDSLQGHAVQIFLNWKHC